MSNARGSEPQLLSIEAIIQKSEQKSKMLNNIPIDFKKLFIEQIVKKLPLKEEPKRSTIVYEGYKNKLESCEISKEKKKITSFASRPNGNNSSPTKKILRSNSMQPITTARASSESRKMKRSHRQSLAEIVTYKQFVESNDENENIMNYVNEGKNKTQLRETWQCESFFPIGSSGLRKMQSHKNKIEICERIDTLESQPKSEGNKAYEIKLDLKLQEQSPKCKNSDKFSKTYYNFSKTQSNFPKNISAKKKSSSEKIPNFVIEAVAHEREEIEKNCSPVKNFEFEINEDEQDKNGKMRDIKPPMSLINLKKKVDFLKSRRSEESFEEALKPKINLIKLQSKEKTSAIKNRHIEKNIRDGLARNLQKVKRKHIQAEEEVRGWDLGHEDEF